MATIKTADVVVANFPGITAIKRRPAVVLSTEEYHLHHPDVILGAITTNLAVCITPHDWVLKDWQAAGLRQPSAFRAFLVALPRQNIFAVIGQLSDADWVGVQGCIRRALAV